MVLLLSGLSVKARRTVMIVGLVGAVAIALLLPAFQVCRDWAFIDRNTGSRKGHRDWFLGWRSGSWYRESAIEDYMRSRHSSEFQQDWVSYAGTGRNIFGAALLYGHGRPGPIVMLKPEVIDDYCKVASEMEKRRLYDVFASGDKAKIQVLVDHILESAPASQRSNPDNASNRNLPIHTGKNHAPAESKSDF